MGSKEILFGTFSNNNNNSSSSSSSILSIHLYPRNKSFKIISCILNIPQCGCRVHTWVAHNDHNIRIDSELIYVGSKPRILDLHALKLRLGLATAQLELFDDIGNLFKPMGIKMVCPRAVLVGNRRRQCRRIQIGGNLAGRGALHGRRNGLADGTRRRCKIVVRERGWRRCRQSILQQQFCVGTRLGLRNDQKGCPFKQYDFVGIANPTKLVEMGFQQSNVGNQIGNNLGPCLVQGFVPNGGSKTLKVFDSAGQTGFLNELFAILQNGFSIFFGDQIHLVNQQKNAGVRRILFDRLQDATKVIKVLFWGLGFDIKDVNQQFDAPKDGFPISLKVGFVKGVLATTIP
mmetsp:Transcript_883/g.2043  ORF Transcript_883/g.2043 Transcript_883/m.2043 type:complete len:346 (-) Transcript_883:370-1407(-)